MKIISKSSTQIYNLYNSNTISQLYKYPNLEYANSICVEHASSMQVSYVFMYICMYK